MFMPTGPQTANRPMPDMKLLETVRSDESGIVKPPMIQTTQNPTGNVTHEPFKLSEKNSAVNSKMLSTYRGADNMKFRIIDQSVLKTFGGSNASTARQKAAGPNFTTIPVEKVDMNEAQAL